MEFENKKFTEEIYPLYIEMVTLFTDKFWLASRSTRKWYSEFCWFVGLWERHLDKSIPPEVIEKLDIKEKDLKPFYQNLYNELDRLQTLLVIDSPGNKE